MELLLKGLTWHDGTDVNSGDILIRKGVIHRIENELPPNKNAIVRVFQSHFVYPGLINAHDHLEMNFYPKLGQPYYKNYIEWARDIYKPAESPVRDIEKLDIKARLLWGGFKNLISGVTTVVHHNPWHRILGAGKFPVKVLKKMAWAHSLAFQKKIEKSFPAKQIPFVIHAGEGTDEIARREVFRLEQLGFLRPNTVLIHCVALTDETIRYLKANHSSIVWCPASNLFMFGETCPVQKAKTQIRIALGSDSTLTGSPTLLHEMKAADQTKMASAKEIFDMVTTVPADVFGLSKPTIQVGKPADLFIAPIYTKHYFENLLLIEPRDICFVVKDGQVKLSNAKDTGDLKYEVSISGMKRFIDFDLQALTKSVTKKVEPSWLNANPLWQMIAD